MRNERRTSGSARGDVKPAVERRQGAHRLLHPTYLKVRRGGRIVSVAVIIAVGVNTDGRREVLGMEIGTSEAEPIWTEFLRKLTRRGLRGVKLVVSDAHEGLKAAVTKVLSAIWQRRTGANARTRTRWVIGTARSISRVRKPAKYDTHSPPAGRVRADHVSVKGLGLLEDQTWLR
jgi:hypothetical protein